MVPLLTNDTSICATLYLTNLHLPPYANKFFFSTLILTSLSLFQSYKRCLAAKGNVDAAETLVLGIYKAVFWYIATITLACWVAVTYYDYTDTQM